MKELCSLTQVALDDVEGEEHDVGGAGGAEFDLAVVLDVALGVDDYVLLLVAVDEVPHQQKVRVGVPHVRGQHAPRHLQLALDGPDARVPPELHQVEVQRGVARDVPHALQVDQHRDVHLLPQGSVELAIATHMYIYSQLTISQYTTTR